MCPSTNSSNTAEKAWSVVPTPTRIRIIVKAFSPVARVREVLKPTVVIVEIV